MEFITSMTQRAMEIGRPGKVQVEDIIFLVRKQPNGKRPLITPKVETLLRSTRTVVTCFLQQHFYFL